MNDDVIFKANFTSDSVEFNPKFASNDIVFPAEFRMYIDGSARNYNKLTNKPQINGVTLEGDKTAEELGIDVVTYTLTQDPVDGHTIALEGSDGYESIITIPDDGEENRIDSVSLNGIPIIPDAHKNVNIEISVPTKTSELENDSGYITEEDVPTKLSELENDSGYIKARELTQAQYDALTPEEKMNGTMYLIYN